jgi:hypothetical protein
VGLIKPVQKKMKGPKFSAGLVVTIMILAGCNKPLVQDPVPVYPKHEPPYAGLEKRIREEYDYRAVFTWGQYNDLLIELSKEKYQVLPLNEMRNTFNNSKVVIGLRHDIDMNPFKALEMAKMEKNSGIRATYFILPTADYYGYIYRTGLNRSVGFDVLIKELYKTGAEIGIHNDMLTAMIAYGFDPLTFNRRELDFLNSLGIPVTGTASHGSPIAKKTVPNYQIFSDYAKSDSVLYEGKMYPIGKHSLMDFGFQYEAYFINFNFYYSESGGKWNDENGMAGILLKLQKSVPGDRIQILAHPDWWGRVSN